MNKKCVFRYGSRLQRVVMTGNDIEQVTSYVNEHQQQQDQIQIQEKQNHQQERKKQNHQQEQEKQNHQRVRQEQEKKQSPTLTDFQVNCLKRHNHYRNLHGCPPLELDSELSQLAQEWADFLLMKGTLLHREGNPFGENLFLLSSNRDSAFPDAESMAVDSWYEEHNSFFTNPDLNNIRKLFQSLTNY